MKRSNPSTLFPSKYSNVKKEFYDKIKNYVKEGDIFCRLGNAKVFDLLPFSWIVAGATLSNYSHAAMVVEKTDKDILIADVNPYGMSKFRVQDWLNDCIGPFVCILRPKEEHQDKIEKAVNLVKEWFNYDIKYNDSFHDVTNEETPSKLYCTQMVYEAYRRAGLPLECSLVRFADVFPRNIITNFMIKIAEASFGIAWEQLKVVVVGNENFGLLSCPELQKLFEFYSDNRKLLTIYNYFDKSSI